ncbi:hypothetical protein [Micromonospora sp. WMMD737]|uniref:hypothetical protein n=1 Tax=Micromonospora sp. WMMD737 TaxID=3404113 RepID=UPI003B95BC0F
MTDFEPGELVDVTIRAARVIETQPGTVGLTYGPTNGAFGQDGVIGIIKLHRHADVTITRVAPAEWPPQPDDVWRDRLGVHHFGVSYSPDYDDKADAEGIGPDGTRVILVASGGDSSCRLNAPWYRPERINQQSGPLTLVYRRNRDQDGAER